jgi:hypothetical protein
MAALLLQVNHEGGHLVGSDLDSFVQVADLIVLAEHTEQVAAAVKNGAGPAGSHQGRFFTEVRGITGNPGLDTCGADTLFIIKTVFSASAWAEATLLQEFVRLTDSCLQFTAFMKFQISRFHNSVVSGQWSVVSGQKKCNWLLFGVNSFQGVSNKQGTVKYPQSFPCYILPHTPYFFPAQEKQLL